MKKLILITGIITAAIAGTMYYYWRQVTYLPSWYDQKSPQLNTSLNQPDLQQKTSEIKNRITSEINQANLTPEIQLNSQEVNQLIKEEIKQKTSQNPLINQAIKGVNTTIKDQQIETGAVINISDLPKEKLSEKDQIVLDNIKQNLPGLYNKNVYVAIQGKPLVKNGQIVLDENGKVKIGNMTLTMGELAKKLGVSVTDLQEELNLKLPLNRLQIEQIQIEGDKIQIRGKK
jgi:hypothetical protein